MEPGGYCYSHKCSHIWALPTGTSVCACPSHMHVLASKCAYLAGFLIFWAIFRRLSWAVFLLAELFPYFLTFHLPIPLSSPHACLKHCSLLRSSLWAAPGRDTSPGASWQHCLFSASSSGQELALCVLMQWGALPTERKLPRKPQEQNAYGNEARYDKPAARAASDHPNRAEQRHSWRNFSCVVTSSKLVFQGIEMLFVVSEATSCTFTTFKSASLGFSRIRDREILLDLIIIWATRAVLFYMLTCQALCSCLNNSV